ncbi:hypothetical protein HK097_010209 [Rhizophlyctis rosea]|uniref:Uncharacterized protein n=1 Tax=Rhizophlyctis rosea TaxID=64517 RepID=A0AAD5S9J1_9FUNG|nr:hypothetical protein HK097_010209 [Rhizophlyctis rosea]
MARYIAFANYQVQLILTVVELIFVSTIQSCVTSILAWRGFYDVKTILEAGGMSRYIRSSALGAGRGWTVIVALLVVQGGRFIDTLLWKVATADVQVTLPITITGNGTNLVQSSSTNNAYYGSSVTDWDPNARLASIIVGDFGNGTYRVDDGDVRVPAFNTTTMTVSAARGRYWDIRFSLGDYELRDALFGNLTLLSTHGNIHQLRSNVCGTVDQYTCFREGLREMSAIGSNDISYALVDGEWIALGEGPRRPWAGLLRPRLITGVHDTSQYRIMAYLRPDGSGLMVEMSKRSFNFAHTCASTDNSTCLSSVAMFDTELASFLLSAIPTSDSNVVHAMTVSSSGDKPALLCRMEKSSGDQAGGPMRLSGECLLWSVSMVDMRHSVPLTGPLNWEVMIYYGIDLRDTDGERNLLEQEGMTNPRAALVRGLGSSINVEYVGNGTALSGGNRNTRDIRAAARLSAKGTYQKLHTQLDILYVACAVVPSLLLHALSTFYLRTSSKKVFRQTLSQTIVGSIEEGMAKRPKEIYSVVREDGREVVCVGKDGLRLKPEKGGKNNLGAEDLLAVEVNGGRFVEGWLVEKGRREDLSRSGTYGE